MTMPINLVLVRHGESEGNFANKMSRKGDHSGFTDEFKERHSSLWRLTDKGIEQAKTAGRWIQDNLDFRFDRFYASEFLRAMETAAYICIPEARWYREFYLRERGWGQLDVMSDDERHARFADEMKRRKRDGFFWAPPGGESMADCCLRIDRNLDTLHRECSDKNVIIVCHGEVMTSFRVRLERMSQNRFYELSRSKNAFDKIHNCQILHYTRRNPKTGELSNNMNWFRSICPTDLKLSKNKWQLIKRPKFSNHQLLFEVQKVLRIISGK